MPDLSTVITGATYVGIGGVVGPIVVALVQAMGKRSESRGAAADYVTRSATSLAGEWQDAYTEAKADSRALRRSLAALCEAVETLVNELNRCPYSEQHGVDHVRAAVVQAREAL